MLLHIPKEIKQLERHKKYQTIITMGTIVTCALTIVAPSYVEHSIVINTITTLIWVWEK